MMFVRGRDGRKRSELRLGFASGAEMDESEVEEGEACSYQNDDDDGDGDGDYVPTVDPDVALSYIDEKLQNVLGHFQKDFEGGVLSAETLGASYGSYGSFLPTYQRSPVWSHLRSPAKVDSHNLTATPNKSHLEGSVHVLRRHGEASVSYAPKRMEVTPPAQCVEVSCSGCKLEKNRRQQSDVKMVKTSIRGGSNNLSTWKNAEIYSGLGLDISPSSSLGESPTCVGGLYHEHQHDPDDSPSRILHMMTSFPIDKNLLLSPLTDNLINLNIKAKKLPKESKSKLSQKVGKESLNVPNTSKSDDKVLLDKKLKSLKKDVDSPELKNRSDENARKDHGVRLKVDSGIDSLACEKLVTDNVEKFNINVQLNKNGKLKEERAIFSSEAESNISKGGKPESAEFVVENGIFHEYNGMQLNSSKERLSFGSKKKFRGSQGHTVFNNSPSNNEMENPKLNEDSVEKISRYRDFFGEMELDLGDNDVEVQKSCPIDNEKDDMIGDRSKLPSNRTMEKKLNVRKMDRRSMSGACSKSAPNAALISGVVCPSVALYQVPVSSQVKKKDGTKEINGSLNDISQSPQANEADKHVQKEAKNDKPFELPSNKGETQLSVANSKRINDQNGSRVLKKIKMDDCLHRQQEDDEREREKHCQVNGSHQIKSSKKSSLGIEESGSSKSDIDKVKTKIYDSGNESINCRESCEQLSGVDSANVGKTVLIKKMSTYDGTKENNRRESQPKSEETNGSDVKLEPAPTLDQKQIPCPHYEKEKLHSLPPSGRDRSESGTHKENGVKKVLLDASKGNKALEVQKQNDFLGTKGNQLMKLRHSIGNGHTVMDKDVPSPAKRDPSSHGVSNVLKEATNLKHMADRLKNIGSTAESTGLYFQAVLKFLHGAALLEYSSGGEGAKQSEAIQSVQIYSSTGKLCAFVAHEYEKSKDMATAALAYKCMEVAYMKVIYSSHKRASRDRLELRAASQIGPLGDSPHSASDVDKLKGGVISSPQVPAGNNLVPAANHPTFVRLLNYAQDVNFAMEASRKSRIAFAAANQKMNGAKYGEEGMASVKRALEFNFQDVEGLLRLVRLAMEAICH